MPIKGRRVDEINLNAVDAPWEIMLDGAQSYAEDFIDEEDELEEYGLEAGAVRGIMIDMIQHLREIGWEVVGFAV